MAVISKSEVEHHAAVVVATALGATPVCRDTGGGVSIRDFDLEYPVLYAFSKARTVFGLM
jgi:hypothetical protein